MSGEETQLVGATFTERTAAANAAEALISHGLAPIGALAAVWSGDKYVVESPAGRTLRHSVGAGTLAGAAIGLVVAGLIAVAVWTSVSAWVSFAVVGVVGAVAGAVIGGYVGLNRRRRLLWNQRDWTHVTIDAGEVLLVVGVDRPADARAVLAREGGTVVEPSHPQ